MKKHYKTIRLILGDQLNANHSWYREKDGTLLYVIAEMKQEATYVRHHIQKLCAFFSAMQQFAAALQAAGHEVLHLTLDDTQNAGTFPALMQKLCEEYDAMRVEYQRPDEYRLLQQLRNMALPSRRGSDRVIAEVDTEHFLLPFQDISQYFSRDKHHKMEFFYRKMRQRHDILMQDAKPVGGQWNFDTNNRNKLKKQDIAEIPPPLLFKRNIRDIRERIDRHDISFIGSTADCLLWPTNREESKQLLEHFCRDCLPNFGRFQDAMTGESEYSWTLYHSRLSFALNTKMLDPKQVIDRAVQAYESSDGAISVAQIEGFVRQILGWREYIRGVYWTNMPDYAALNTLQAERPLPAYFWNANTKMRCMQTAIDQSLKFSYAHHIQRLMITGNFCLLCGISPDEVDAWYLGIYIDALEWVELPNTRGMSLFADGGLVATKAYSAGGNYINKMSDLCKGCHYNVKEKVTDDACPFNSLYWGFMIKHRDRFERNPRIGMVYRQWDKQDDDTRQKVQERAQLCLATIEDL